MNNHHGSNLRILSYRCIVNKGRKGISLVVVMEEKIYFLSRNKYIRQHCGGSVILPFSLICFKAMSFEGAWISYCFQKTNQVPHGVILVLSLCLCGVYYLQRWTSLSLCSPKLTFKKDGEGNTFHFNFAKWTQ